MRVLAVGAHPDDIELGCGGALVAHRLAGDEVTLLVLTSGERGPTGPNPRVNEQEDAAAQLGATLRWGGFEDGLVPADRRGVSVVDAALRISGADVIYTHAAGDTHQDHQAAHVITMAAARRACRVLCYESPSTFRFEPTVYVDIDGLVEAKLGLLRAHMSQVLRCGLVDLEAVEAQARFRGFQARIAQAEAFEAPRFVWELLPRRTVDADALVPGNLISAPAAVGSGLAVEPGLPKVAP